MKNRHKWVNPLKHKSVRRYKMKEEQLILFDEKYLNPYWNLWFVIADFECKFEHSVVFCEDVSDESPVWSRTGRQHTFAYRISVWSPCNRSHATEERRLAAHAQQGPQHIWEMSLLIDWYYKFEDWIRSWKLFIRRERFLKISSGFDSGSDLQYLLFKTS